MNKGEESVLIEIFIQDSTNSNGVGLTGLLYNSAGLKMYRWDSATASWVEVTLVTMTLEVWASGGFKEMDSVKAPGWYQIGVPNVAMTGNYLRLNLQGAANMVQCPIRERLNDLSQVVQVDMTQAVPITNTAQTLGDAMNAARSQGFGNWAVSGTTLYLYANDGVTAVKTFTLDSATNPTSRS